MSVVRRMLGRVEPNYKAIISQLYKPTISDFIDLELPVGRTSSGPVFSKIVFRLLLILSSLLAAPHPGQCLFRFLMNNSLISDSWEAAPPGPGHPVTRPPSARRIGRYKPSALKLLLGLFTNTTPRTQLYDLVFEGPAWTFHKNNAKSSTLRFRF